MNVHWRGVIPATTTQFNADSSIDFAFFADHCRALADAGCLGVIPAGSLGESATLTFDEKVELFKTAIAAIGDHVPVISGIAALSTAEAVRLAKAAESVGCSALMVLPPYVYSTDWREMKAHLDAVISATPLPVMLYNNPPAYKTDYLPEQIAELAAQHVNLVAVKESSADIRRVTAIRVLLQDRIEVLVGVDDCIVEGVQAGAVGWIAGLVNAFPAESVELFQLAMRARTGSIEPVDRARLDALYTWFLPLLRMDTDPKFVQLIKLAQEMVGKGSGTVRPPRLELVGPELQAARSAIQHALDHHPARGG